MALSPAINFLVGLFLISTYPRIYSFSANGKTQTLHFLFQIGCGSGKGGDTFSNK